MFQGSTPLRPRPPPGAPPGGLKPKQQFQSPSGAQLKSPPGSQLKSPGSQLKTPGLNLSSGAQVQGGQAQGKTPSGNGTPSGQGLNLGTISFASPIQRRYRQNRRSSLSAADIHAIHLNNDVAGPEGQKFPIPNTSFTPQIPVVPQTQRGSSSSSCSYGHY